MDSWLAFWKLLLIGTLALFAILAIVVTIGGFAEVWALFRSVDAQHRSARESEHDDRESGP